MAQTKIENRNGIFHFDSFGKYHYDGGVRPAYIACGKAREIQYSFEYAVGDLVIATLRDDPDVIYHVYKCVSPGVTGSSGDILWSSLTWKFPATASAVYGTAEFQFSYTPEQIYFVNGVKEGKHIIVKDNTRFIKRVYSNNILHNTTGPAYLEYTGGNQNESLVARTYFIAGVEIATKIDAFTYIKQELPSTRLMKNADLLANEGFIVNEKE